MLSARQCACNTVVGAPCTAQIVGPNPRLQAICSASIQASGAESRLVGKQVAVHAVNFVQVQPRGIWQEAECDQQASQASAGRGIEGGTR